MISQCKQKYGSPDNINLSKLLISDDTIMHEATALALLSNELFGKAIVDEYIKCWQRMTPERAAGTTCKNAIEKIIKTKSTNMCQYEQYGGGNGASMRAMCIGLYHNGIADRNDLIIKSILSSIVTHHNATAYLGAIVSALFTSFAIEKVKIENWGVSLLELFPTIHQHIIKKGVSEGELNDVKKFYKKFKTFLENRNIHKNDSRIFFPNNFNNVVIREQIWKEWNFSGWNGASGDDSVMIAYDALLYAKNDWNKLLEVACLHSGDSDSTGTIAASWYGAYYGEDNIPKKQKETVENCNFLKTIAVKLYEKANNFNYK